MFVWYGTYVGRNGILGDNKHSAPAVGFDVLFSRRFKYSVSDIRHDLNEFASDFEMNFKQPLINPSFPSRVSHSKNLGFGDLARIIRSFGI